MYACLYACMCFICPCMRSFRRSFAVVELSCSGLPYLCVCMRILLNPTRMHTWNVSRQRCLAAALCACNSSTRSPPSAAPRQHEISTCRGCMRRDSLGSGLRKLLLRGVEQLLPPQQFRLVNRARAEVPAARAPLPALVADRPESITCTHAFGTPFSRPCVRGHTNVWDDHGWRGLPGMHENSVVYPAVHHPQPASTHLCPYAC
jgi:hypothetical protein